MLKGRYDRFLTKKNALFISAGVAADKPAGKELVGNGQVGYSRRIFADEKHELVGEVGYDFSYEDLVAGDAVSIHSLRAFTGYKGKLREDVGVEGSLEALFNVNTLDTPTGEASAFEDARVNGQVAVTAKLTDHISFAFSFAAKFDNVPAPLPPFAIPYDDGLVLKADTLDTITKASLIVQFL